MTSNQPDDFLNSFESSLKETEQLAKKDPGNKKWQHDLSMCHVKIGNIHHTQGHLDMAMDSFMSSLKIMEQLIKGDPENNEWLYEISEIYEMIGNIHEESRNYNEAIGSYKSSLNLIEQFAKREPVNPEWQHEMSQFYEIIGNIQQAQGNPSAALKSYMISHVINEMLLKDDPGNIEIQNSLRITNEKIEFIEQRGHQKNLSSLNTLYELESSDKSGLNPGDTKRRSRTNRGRLNNIYGNMQKAMQGNPALTKQDDMLREAGTTPPKPGRLSENVNFAVSFPSTMIAAESYILDVWLFLEEQRNILLGRIKEENWEDTSLKSEGPVIIERGTVITARLTIENLIVEPSEKTLTWAGDLTNSSFIVSVPENINEGTKIGFVNFYIYGLEISRLNFKLNITSKHKEESKIKNGFAENKKYKSAFASYASDDRNDVLARVQGLEKAGVHVFVDVHELRSGEKYEEKLLEEIRGTDIFYLFWSMAAKKSEWVEKEWKYALNSRGIDFIDPIPLDSPDIAPPPPELGQTLHFGDWTLAYKRSKTVNRQ